jgi:hypothetical protein
MIKMTYIRKVLWISWILINTQTNKNAILKAKRIMQYSIILITVFKKFLVINSKMILSSLFIECKKILTVTKSIKLNKNF